MPEGFYESIARAGEAGTALTTTTPSSVINAARKIATPVPFFNRANRALRIFAAGKISTAGASPGTLKFDVRFGSTVVFDGGASGTLVTSGSNLTWRLNIDLVCRAVGGSATVLGTGELKTFALSATVPFLLLPASSPAAGTAFDGSVSQIVDLFATFSATGNSLTCEDFEVEWATN